MGSSRHPRTPQRPRHARRARARSTGSVLGLAWAPWRNERVCPSGAGRSRAQIRQRALAGLRAVTQRHSSFLPACEKAPLRPPARALWQSVGVSRPRRRRDTLREREHAGRERPTIRRGQELLREDPLPRLDGLPQADLLAVAMQRSVGGLWVPEEAEPRVYLEGEDEPDLTYFNPLVVVVEGAHRLTPAAEQFAERASRARRTRWNELQSADAAAPRIRLPDA
jgi:hypothetical protein